MNPKMTSSQLLYEKKLLSEIPSQPGRAGWGSCDADRCLHQARLRDFYHRNLTSWELPIQRYTSLVQIPNHSEIIQVRLCSACGSSSLCFLCWDFFPAFLLFSLPSSRTAWGPPSSWNLSCSFSPPPPPRSLSPFGHPRTSWIFPLLCFKCFLAFAYLPVSRFSAW